MALIFKLGALSAVVCQNTRLPLYRAPALYLVRSLLLLFSLFYFLHFPLFLRYLPFILSTRSV